LTLTKVEALYFSECLHNIKNSLTLIFSLKEHIEQIECRNQALHEIDKLLGALKK